MNIAYFNGYLGPQFMFRYCEGKSFTLSGPLKSLGIARAMMAAGHQVTMFSTAITTCNTIIPAFSEVEEYPEGKLTIKYCNILSRHKCDPINQMRMARYLKREHKREQFDAIVFYNITLGASLLVKRMNGCIKVLEYEDNIFNKALIGDKNNFEWFKHKMYRHIISYTNGVMAVCNGLMLPEIHHRILTPGIINEEVVNNISTRVNKLKESQPVHVILTGGIHYSKGGDLLVKSLSYIKTPCVISVYGNCGLDNTMKELMIHVPAYHKFELKGYMPHEQLIKTLDRDADILINTTRSMHVGTQAAGFPFKMMEYASTGRPIVSSEIGKLDENYNSHITYYDGEDPQAIAAAIEDVIANYDAKVQSALELQRRVLTEYTIKAYGRKLDVFFKEIAAYEFNGK